MFYVGDTGATRFHGMLELSDGTLVVGGDAADLSWVPEGTPQSALATSAANGSSIKQDGVDTGATAFILRLSADASQVISVHHFPPNSVHNVKDIKTNTPPGQPTGDLFISGQRAGEAKDSGYFIAKLDGNFVDATPTEMEYVWNLKTGKSTSSHGRRQPWDVMSDGRIVAQIGREYGSGWGEIAVYPANPGPFDANSLSRPKMTTMPGLRMNRITSDGGATNEIFYGPESDIPDGYEVMENFMFTKTQATNHPGLLRSYTAEDYHHWEKDENGFWRKGKYPMDVFWNSYWWKPLHGSDNSGLSSTRGYTGYKLSGTGGTEGAPYTPRVGAITVDKRNDRIYLGLNWASRLPATNNPDFEPALIVLDKEGYFQWWARMYKEYNDDSDEAPEAFTGEVTQVNGNEIVVPELAGETIDLSRKTGGSDGYINGYRRLYLQAGATHERRFREIEAFDSASGTLTLVEDTDYPVSVGDPVLVDATEMGKTHTSTPDQYVDAIAIDYSSPMDAEGVNTIVYVGARSHGNNVVNFWNGNAIKAKTEGGGFVNRFTGSNGNIHLSWLGKYRDEGDRSTILASTYVAEYVDPNDFGSGNNFGGTVRDDPNYDFWPNQNGGNPARNTTSIGARMHVNSQGQLVVYGEGRTVQTTPHAYQRNIRPFISATVSEAESASILTAENIIGADLVLTNCRIKLGGEIRQVTAFDNSTGQIFLETPLSAIPSVGTSFSIDEGSMNWGNFVRVYSEDLGELVYSTLLSSAINPVDGVGTQANSRIFTAWPVGDNILVSGYHANGADRPIPTANQPAWGKSSPIDQEDTAFFAVLSTTQEPPADSAPEILNHPESKTAIVGSDVVFSVIASGSPEPQIQWYHDGDALPDETGSVLQLDGVTEESGGSYYAVASNGVSPDAVSDAAVLSVEEAPAHGTILVDFGTGLDNPPQSGNWNAGITEDTSGLLNVNGEETSVGVELNNWTNSTSESEHYTDEGGASARTELPAWAESEPIAINDRLWLSKGKTGADSATLRITGLDVGRSYRMEIASSQAGGGRNGSEPGYVRLEDANGIVPAKNAFTGGNLPFDSTFNGYSWTVRVNGNGGEEGWLLWEEVVADAQGEVLLTTSTSSEGTSRGALNTLYLEQLPENTDDAYAAWLSQHGLTDDGELVSDTGFTPLELYTMGAYKSETVLQEGEGAWSGLLRIGAMEVNSDGGMDLNFTGQPDRRYVLQHAEDLSAPVEWTDGEERIPTEEGPQSFTIGSPPGDQAFYRIKVEIP
ncbi:MAG: immunoglobulin domain-containing protein [Opitutales bacterium]